jgi:protein-arginine kinase activator protein McsA
MKKKSLKRTALQEERTQTDVLRSYIRSLKRKIKTDTPLKRGSDLSHA